MYKEVYVKSTVVLQSVERGVAECSRLEQAYARRREQLALTHERLRAMLHKQRDQVRCPARTRCCTIPRSLTRYCTTPCSVSHALLHHTALSLTRTAAPHHALSLSHILHHISLYLTHTRVTPFSFACMIPISSSHAQLYHTTSCRARRWRKRYTPSKLLKVSI